MKILKQSNNKKEIEKKKINKKSRFWIKFLLIIILLINVYFVIKIHFQGVVKEILLNTLEIKVEFEDVKISTLGKLKITKVKIKNLEGEELVKAKEVIIDYNINNIKHINSITAKNAEISIRLYEDYKVSIAETFVKDTENSIKKDKKEKNKKEKVKLDKIAALDSIVKYRDETLEEPFEKILKNVNGVLLLDENNDVSIRAIGSNNSERYEFYLYQNENDKIEFELKANDVNIDNKIMQYAYKEESISYERGLVDVYIKKSEQDITGEAFFKGVKIKYEDIKEEIEYISGKADILKNEVVVKATGFLQKNKADFDLNYNMDNKILKIGIKAENVNYKVLKNYNALENIDIPVNGSLNTAELKLEYSVNDKKLNLFVKGDADRIFFAEHEFSYLDFNLSYFNNRWNINKLSFNYGTEIYDKINISANIFFRGNIENENLEGKFILNDFNSNLNIKDLKGNIKYDFKSSNLNIDYQNEEYFINGNLEYNSKNGIRAYFNSDKPVKLKYKDYEAKILGKLNLNYNMKNKKIEKTEYDLKIFGFKNIEKISIDGEFDNDILKFKKIYVTQNESYTYLVGDYNLKNEKYNFKIIQTQVNLKEILKDFKEDIWFNGLGKIKGEKNKFTIDTTIESYSGKYYIDYEILRGKIILNYDGEKFTARGNSILKKLGFQNQYVQDLDIRYRYRDNMLYIDKFANNILTISGNCNIIDKSLDLNYKLNEYQIKQIIFLKDYDFSGNIKEITGNVKGDFENPVVNMNVKNMNLNYKNIKNIKINGNFGFEKDTLYFKDLYIDQNLISGKYNLNTEDLECKINIMENSFEKYYSIPNMILNFKAFGELNLWGNLKNIRGIGKLNLSKVYYEGIEMPNLYLRFTYNKGNFYDILNTGIVNFSEIELLGQNREKVISSTAYIDLETKKTEFNIEEQEFNIEKMQYIYPETELKGNVKLKFNLKSNLEKLDYTAEITSKELYIKNIEIKDIKNKIKGNEKEINVDTISMNYNGNPINLYGNMKLNPLKYNFRIFANNTDLSFLNIFLKDNFKDIKGRANVNIFLNDEDTRGSLFLKNVSFSDIKSFVEVENLNANMNFEKQTVNISKFTGNINKGKFNIEGFVGIPKIDAEKITNFREMNKKNKLKLDFEESPFAKVDSNLNIDFENIVYYHQNLLRLNFSGNLKMRNKKISGLITLNEGEIRGIPDKIETEKKENTNNILSLVDLDINFMIKSGMKISLDKFSVIEDIEANIEGGGRLKNVNENLNFLGTISTGKGVITFNGNYFEIEKGMLVFDDPYRYLPDLNPVVSISAKTEIAREKIYVKINGNYKELSYVLLAENPDLSHEDIISLLAFHNKLIDSTPQGVVKDRLEEQLRKEIFEPISKKIEEIFALSKVRLYSDVLKQEGEDITLTEDLRLGATAEFRDILYKNIIFWNLKVKLSSEEPGQLDYYDFWVDYNIRENMSISLGMKRQQKTESETEGNLHIDLEFRKKFNFNFF